MISIDVLKKLREQHGWTQEQLASVSGISARTIQRIESTGDCSLESKMAIAAAFNVAPSFLSGSDHAGEHAIAPSPLANLSGWAILIAVLLGILLIQGGGVIKERLHICAVIMVVTFLALALRTINSRELAATLLFCLGFSGRKGALSLRLMVLTINQLIKFVYISAVLALCFFGWYMSQQWAGISLFSKTFANLLGNAAMASLFYAIFVAELLFRTAKLRIEAQIVRENNLY